MTTVYIIIGIAITVALVAFLFSRSKRVRKKDGIGELKNYEYSSSVYLDHYYKGTTPKGAKVYSVSVDVTDEKLARIDRGIQNTLDIVTSAPYNYTEKVSHADYLVSLWEPSPLCTTAPSFAVTYMQMPEDLTNPSGYDQGIYDKNPTKGVVSLCVAGKFELFKNVPALAVVDDAELTVTGAQFETEHAIALFNDPDLYNATYDHSQGGGHPIYPQPQAVGLMSASPTHIHCAVPSAEEKNALKSWLENS